MKQFFRFFAVLFMTVFATASAWAITERTLPTVNPQTFSPDVEYYILNVGTGKWITKGESWNTQSIVGATGMRYQVSTQGIEVPQGTYVLYSAEAGNSKVMARVVGDGNTGAGSKAVFSDGHGISDATHAHRTQYRIFWELIPVGNYYLIRVPSSFIEGSEYYVEDYGFVEGEVLGIQTDYPRCVRNPTYGLYYDIDIESNLENCEFAFILPDEYNSVKDAMAIYAASIPLLQAIKEVQAYSLDASEAIAVYENTASTIAQLDAAKTALQPKLDLIAAKKTLKSYIDEAEAKNIDVTAEKAVFNNPDATAEEIAAATKSVDNKLASPTHPVEIEGLITNPAPYANLDGWTCYDGSGKSANPNAFDSGNKNAEFWNQSGFSIHQTVSNVPAGIYQLQALAFTRTDMKAYLRIKKGDAVIAEKTIVTYSSSEVNNRAGANTLFNSGKGVNQLVFYLSEASDIEISLTADNTTGDHWMVWRSFAIQNIGNGVDTYLPLAQDMLPEGWENWETEYEGQFAQPYFDALYEAADALEGATTSEEAKAAFEIVYNAVNGFYKNIELVTKLQDSYAVYEGNHLDLGESRAGDPAVDPCDALLETADGWIMAIDDADDEAMKAITNEAIEKWFADWAIAYEDCKQFSLTDIKEGVEGNCNILLQHPGFKDDMGSYTTEGWTITGKAPNFFQGFPLVAEVWDANFDASQTVKLPHDGAYSLHTHGFYRCGNTDVAWQRWQAAGSQETQNLTGANAENTCRAYLYADNLTERFSNTFHTIYTRAQVEALAATVYTSDFLDKYITGKNNGKDWAKSGNGPLTETFDECITGGRTNPYDFSFNLIATKETVQSDPDIPALIPNGVYSAHAVFTDPTYGPDYNMAINFLGRKDQVVRVGVKAENIQAQGWTIFEPFKLTWYGKDVPRLVEVMEKVLDQANTLAAEPMQKDSLAALTNGLGAAQDAINSADGEALLNAYDAIVAAMGPAEKSRDAYIPLVEKKAQLDEAIETYKETAMESHLATATALQTEVANAIAGGTIEDADIAAKVEEMALAIKHLPISNEPGDFTGVIDNPTYCVNDAASLSGWSFNETNSETKALAPNAQLNSVGGVNMGIVEGWNGSEFNFNIWQDLDGLPQGYYLVTLQAAFRPFDNPTSVRRMGLAATADEPVTSLEGVTKLYSEIADSLTYMYANDETAIFQSLYILPTNERDLAQWADNNGSTDSWWTGGTYKNEQEEDVEYFVQLIGDEQTPAYIPGNRPTMAYRFGTRHFLATDDEFPSGDFFFTNKLTVYVGADGNLRIGVRNDNAAGNSWSPFTNWHLYYCGTEGVNPTGINELSDNTAKTVKTTVYSIDGRQMNGTVRGVNIVKTRDNSGKETVRKVIVK